MKKLCRVIFSRYFITAVISVAELVMLALLLSYASSYSYVFLIVSAALNIMVVLSLISRDINPEFKVSWLVVTLFIPVFGSMLYVMFYSRRMSKREARLTDEISRALIDCGSGERTDKALCALAAKSPSAAGRARSILKDDIYAELFCGGDIKYYDSAEDMYSSMLRDLSSAERYIFMEYFIIEDGVMWQGIFDILKIKAAEGVDVRLLYDDIGCMRTLPRGFASQLSAVGISCLCFGRVTPLLVANNNNRDHRKITVIDGEIAYTGGANIADEYINEKCRFGHWKDGGVRVCGSCAKGFTRLFLSSFFLALGRVDMSLIPSDTDGSISEKAREPSPVYSFEDFFIPFGDGPAPLSPEYTSKNAFMNIINQSQSYLYITTPYLIVDYDLSEALCSAAKRGVDVRIITPGIPDKKIVKIMTKSSYPRLISGGVRIFEYAEGFIHGKLMVADGENAIVGTVNLDYRSLVHHFENGLWIYGSAEITEMRDCFLRTLALCREIDKRSAKLSIFERLVRAIVRIFSPLL